MTYERPDIQLLYALHAPGDQSISPVGKDLRARESKEFTDSNAGRDPLNLSGVSKQVALPTSARQAHWVFTDSKGKAIKGYVKEGVSQVLQNNCKPHTQPKKRRKELPRAPRSRAQRIYLRSTLPRAAHSASNPPKVGKGNGVDITGWLVSPGVRSIYAEDGAVLLNTKNGLYYRLKPVAARVWVMIEGSPAGIGFEGILDVLETHFAIARGELERDARDCLAELQLAGLVTKESSRGAMSLTSTAYVTGHRKGCQSTTFRHEGGPINDLRATFCSKTGNRGIAGGSTFSAGNPKQYGLEGQETERLH